jgi:hypothetical protein
MIYEIVFPGRTVFSLSDLEIADRLVREYQSLVDEECAKIGIVARPVPEEAFGLNKRKVDRTGICADYSDLYTHATNPDIRVDMKKDAERYVAGLK